MEIAKFTRLEARRIVIFGHFVTLASPSLRLKMSCPSTQHLKLHPAHSGLETQIDGLREVGAMLWQRCWSVGTSSNYSVVISRDPLELLITASGKDKGRLSRADFVRVGVSGKPTMEG